MNDILIVPTLSDVGNSPCYPTEQARYIDFMTKTIWKLPMEQLTGLWVSDVAPADQSNLWLKLDGTTGYPTRLYQYATGLGQWVCPYRIPALAKERMVWVGTPAELWAYDGGDGSDPASTVSISTGSFWEVDTNFADNVAGGVGTDVAAVDTSYDIVATGTGGPEVRGVYYAKRTERNFHVG